MNDYVGKICPVCKQEFNEFDEVTACPDCGMPHHTECWEMNVGCSTFGCAQQGSIKKEKLITTFTCSKCGVELQDGQEFCPKCGTQRGGIKKNVCGKCGAELTDDQEFCSKCGQKVGLVVDNNVSYAINQFNAGVTQANEKKKKVSIIAAVAVVIVILLAVVGAKIAPMIFIDCEGYMEQGNYEKAYKKAKTEDEKQAVRIENLAAVQSAYSADYLKDPSSFSLRDAYYKEDKDSDGDPIKHLVLYISGANSYGATVSNYWLYKWDDENKEWEYYTSVADLTEEEIYSWDDTDEWVEKMLNNWAREDIIETMGEGYKLSKDGVKRINRMFEEDILDDIDLLEINAE